MRIAVLGATGRTGRLLVTDLARRGHTLAVLVRSSAHVPANVAVEDVVIGDSRRRGCLDQLLVGADAVVSALGRVGPEPDLHHETVVALIPAMAAATVPRFVGISSGAVRLADDLRNPRASALTWAARAIHQGTAKDKAVEHAAWAASDREWTLVRPLRLVDGRLTKHVEHDAHRPPSSAAVTRVDLAVFMSRVVSDGHYVCEAPFLVGPRH